MRWLEQAVPGRNTPCTPRSALARAGPQHSALRPDSAQGTEPGGTRRARRCHPPPQQPLAPPRVTLPSWHTVERRAAHSSTTHDNCCCCPLQPRLAGPALHGAQPCRCLAVGGPATPTRPPHPPTPSLLPPPPALECPRRRSARESGPVLCHLGACWALAFLAGGAGSGCTRSGPPHPALSPLPQRPAPAQPQPPPAPRARPTPRCRAPPAAPPPGVSAGPPAASPARSTRRQAA